MKKILVCLLLMSIAGFISADLARADDATSTPASAPAVDLSTPRSAALSFAAAADRGDAAAARQCIVSDADANKLVDASAALASAKERFRGLVAKFGPGSKHLLAAIGEMSPMSADIQNAKEKIDGNDATLTFASGIVLSLTKTDAGWKIDLTKMPRFKQVITHLQSMYKMAGAFNSVSDQIDAGKLKTLAQVRAAIMEALKNAQESAGADDNNQP